MDTFAASDFELDPDSCYAAISARDRRFDGQFFTAVRSTGIFCRPICPATTPQRRNVSFFRSAAAALEAGYRPCLRCRPERAPGLNPMLFPETLFRQALAAVNAGALDGQSAGQLATRLGISERHLRRLFERYLGVSPSAVAGMRRALLAKQLLEDNDLPLTQVAYAAGFNSVRRFNHVMRSVYHDAPSLLRHLAGERIAASVGQAITVHVPYRSPLAWEPLAAFLGKRAIAGVEAVSNGIYRRVWRARSGRANAIEVAHAPERHALRVTLWLEQVEELPVTLASVRRLFDVDTDTLAVEAHLARDQRFSRVVARRPGLRVPGAWDGFELAVRAILGQQVSVAAASTLAGRLVARHGVPLAAGHLPREFATLGCAFPTPPTLAQADLSRLGLSATRARYLSGLAQAVAANPRVLDSTPALLELAGIGAWTAQYIAMRAQRDPNAFPATDLGVRKAIQRIFGITKQTELELQADTWAPWRAYAVMHCWESLGELE